MDEKPITNLFDEDEKAGRQPIVWAMLGIVALGCGLLFAAAFIYFRPDAKSLYDRYFPSPTATNTRTPIPTSTTTSTPTPNMTATQRVIRTTSTAQAILTTVAEAGNNWDVILVDEFDSNANEWTVGEDDDEYANLIRTMDNGVYTWNATAKKGFVSWLPSPVKSTTNFLLTVEGRQTEGTNSADYGVVFRDDGKGNFYLFGINNEGFFVSINFDNDWQDLIERTASDAIQPDVPNRLSVIANGSHFIFLINNQIVGETTDEHIPRGMTGLAIQVYEAGLQATFEFDNFELRIP